MTNINITKDKLSNKENIRKSGPVSRPIDELVNYTMILECLMHIPSRPVGLHQYQIDILRRYICPHWIDVFAEKEISL